MRSDHEGFNELVDALAVDEPGRMPAYIQEILDAARARDVAADARDAEADLREQALDLAGSRETASSYGPEQRHARLDRERARNDRAASRRDLEALARLLRDSPRAARGA